ncbi:MAG: hypothetical protein PHD55_11870 [Methanoregula sp.]|nr:hypothetical protein [Methanoregula sp.]
MSRGRQPTKNRDAGIAMAQGRGTVMQFVPDTGRVCDFMIRGAGRIVFVRIKRAARLHCGVLELAEEYKEQIAGLRTLPGSGPVTRELWLYSKKCAWRYFRVTDTGIEEISPVVGNLIPAGKTPAGSGAVTAP